MATRPITTKLTKYEVKRVSPRGQRAWLVLDGKAGSKSIVVKFEIDPLRTVSMWSQSVHALVLVTEMDSSPTMLTPVFDMHGK